MRGLLLPGALLLLCAACAAAPAPPPPPPDAGPGEPPVRCPAGTMLFPGDAECRPGDWAGCADGFAPEDGGWGCAEVLPPLPCTGATREALGEAACRPVGDCARAAPPDATHFVDAALSGPEDATHFRTLTTAVAAVPSGAKVFVRPGRYAEALTLSRPITLVGQCPGQVEVTVPTGVTASTIRAASTGVALDGLTLSNGYVGLSVGAGASVVAKDLVLDGNGAVGISLADTGSSLVLSSSVVRNTQPRGSGSGWGLSVQAGSQASLVDCAFAGNHVTGLRASGAGSTITGQSVVVRDTRAGTVNDWGRAGVAQRGARLVLARAALLDSVETGVVVAEASVAELTDVVVRDTRPNSAGAFGRALNVSDGSRLLLERGTLARNRDAALMVVGQGAFADVRASVIHSTTRSGDDVARGITVQEGAALALSGSAVVGSREGGVVIVDDGSFGSLARCAITGTSTDSQGAFGHGLVGGLSTVALRACHVSSNGGVGLAFGPGSFVVEDATVSDNATGLFADSTVVVKVVDQVPASAGPLEALVSSSTRFLGNATRTGAGALALPPGLGR